VFEAKVNRVTYGGDWQPSSVDWSSTRGRILLAAASLFAQRGYFGTSTRDIAEAVHIRQPSLFHHFEAKHAVFRALVEMDLGAAIHRLQCRLAEDSTWAEKLHLTVAGDVRVALLQTFDSRGLYQDAVLTQPEFEAERQGIALFHELMEQLIIGGQNSGEFVDVEPSFVQRAVNGVLFETVREQGGPNGPVRHARPLQAGDFVLRAVLVDPAALSAVRETTRRRLDDLEGAAVG
jgi:AcrR family transcriptional regulator